MYITKLTARKLIRISGPDCYPYLQGLLTNDLRILYKGGQNVITSFMLNAQGRTMCDLLVYKTPQTRDTCEFTPPGAATAHDELIIECDDRLSSGLAKTLFGYRVRRKISVNIERDLVPYCLFSSQPKSFKNVKEIISNDITLVNDPRISAMGARCLVSQSSTPNFLDKVSSLHGSDIAKVSPKHYLKHRITLGIGEGIEDHPESASFPLEANGDILRAISFNKGCYLGQELTSRTYNTGVIRKRLMPITVKDPDMERMVPGSEILDDNRKSVGVLRRICDDVGLALMRYESALQSKQLVHEVTGSQIIVHKPQWWTV